MKKLHEQDLIEILAELEDCHSDRAETIKEHIADGRFYPLHRKYIPGYHKPVKTAGGKKTSTVTQIFPKDQWECPILFEDAQPWSFLPIALVIKTTLETNLKTQPWRFAPSSGSSELDYQAARELVESIPTENRPKTDTPLSSLVKRDLPRRARQNEQSV